MLERDWRLFLRDGEGKSISIAQLPKALVAYLGAASEKVYLHHTYAVKAAEKHGLSPAWFSLIFDAVERGTAIGDRPAHITFFYFYPETKRWFQVSVKCAADTKRIYLATFHRVNARKIQNKLDKYPILQK